MAQTSDHRLSALLRDGMLYYCRLVPNSSHPDAPGTGEASPVDKAELLDQLLSQARVDLDVALQAQRATMQGATHEEAKPENDKDTRALESTYLARGQAARVLELQEALAVLGQLRMHKAEPAGPIKVGSLIAVEEKGHLTWCYLVPAGAGRDLSVSGESIKVVSHRSPLGQALIGQFAGDDLEVRSPGGLRELHIRAIW